MIDFTTLQGLTIPEGVVTQITDASGNVIWSAEKPKPVILEVAKITSATYQGSSSWADEQFLLLSIYPKISTSTIKVTYGGLTKTLNYSSMDAQNVYFGTFNGISDSVSTPASGTLTIEGDYLNFGVGSYSATKNGTDYCGCITAVKDWGNITEILPHATRNCKGLTSITITDSITAIGKYAFYNTGLTSVTIPNSITSLGADAFGNCLSLTNASIGNGITEINSGTFQNCRALHNVTIPNNVTRINTKAFFNCLTLSSITIPKSVQYIGSEVFAAKLGADESVTITFIMLSPAPATLYIDAAGNCMPFGNHLDYDYHRTIIVPTGCGNAYKTAEGWSLYADDIREAS